MGRRLPQDKPSRTVRGRTATIYRATDDPHVYYVNVEGNQLSEPAYYGGTDAIEQGTRVRVTTSPELNRWHIEKVDEPNWFYYVNDESVIDISGAFNNLGDDYTDTWTIFDGAESILFHGALIEYFTIWFFDYQGDDWPTVEDGTLCKATINILDIPDSITLYARLRHYFDLESFVELARSENFKGVGLHELTMTLQGDVVSPLADPWLGQYSAQDYLKKNIFEDQEYILEFVAVDSDPDELGHDIVMRFNNRDSYFAVDRPMLADNLDEWEGMVGGSFMPPPFVIGDKIYHITGIGNNLVLYSKKISEIDHVTVIDSYGIPSLNSWTPVAWLGLTDRVFYPADETPIVVGNTLYVPVMTFTYDVDTEEYHNVITLYSWNGVGTKFKIAAELDLGVDRVGINDPPTVDYTDYGFSTFFACKLDNDHIGLTYGWNAFRTQSTGLEFPVLLGTQLYTEVKYTEWSEGNGWSEPIVVVHQDTAYDEENDPFHQYADQGVVSENIVEAYDDGVWIIYTHTTYHVADFTWFSAKPVQNTIYASYVKDGVVSTPIQLVQSTIPVSLVLSGDGPLFQWASAGLTAQIAKRLGVIYLPILGSYNVQSLDPPPNANLVTFTDEASPSVGLVTDIIDPSIENIRLSVGNLSSSIAHVSDKDEEHNYLALSDDPDNIEGLPAIQAEKDYGQPAIPIYLTGSNGPFFSAYHYTTKGVWHDKTLYSFFQLQNNQTASGWMLGLLEYTPVP